MRRKNAINYFYVYSVSEYLGNSGIKELKLKKIYCLLSCLYFASGSIKWANFIMLYIIF